MNALALTLRQVRYTNRAFWRSAAAAVFTFAFPIMFIVLLAAVFGGGEVTVASGATVSTAAFYVAGIGVFAVVSACFTNIAMLVTIQRDSGVLKRVRGTPLPGGAYIGARVLHSVAVAVLLVAICAGLGAAFYGVSLASASIPAVLLTVVLGGAALSALGLAFTAVIPNAHAASPMVNAVALPLLLVSDVFVPPSHLPSWLATVAAVFPVRHFSDALQIAFFPDGGSGFSWPDLAVLVAWGIVGLALALRFFSWEPRT